MLIALVSLVACGFGETQDTAPTTLPEPQDTGSAPVDTDGVPFPVDTALDTGFDQVPADTITFEQRGLWSIDPETQALSGTLLAIEYYNDARPELPDTGDTADTADTGTPDTGTPDTGTPDTGTPDTGTPDTGGDTGDTGLEEEEVCLVRYEVLGTPLSEHTCASCTLAWEIQFTIVEGTTDACQDPDLPLDGEIAHFGWDPTQELILHDYAGTHLWLAWWDAMEAGDLLAIQWVASMGVVLPEEGT